MFFTCFPFLSILSLFFVSCHKLSTVNSDQAIQAVYQCLNGEPSLIFDCAKPILESTNFSTFVLWNMRLQAAASGNLNVFQIMGDSADPIDSKEQLIAKVC